MRNLKTIVNRELAAANISKNSCKQAAMTVVIDRLLKAHTIGEKEYQDATLYGLEYVGMAKREVSLEW